MNNQDANGNESTLPKLYQNYMNAPLTNVPPDVTQKGHHIVDGGDAAALYDKIWTEVKGS